jgi:hypothetical protein
MTHFEKIADTTPVLFSYSAQYVGLILFFISSGSILLLYLLRKKTPQNTFFVSLLISLFSFVVLTKMHERYLAPTLPFLALLSATQSSWLWIIYFLVSVVHLSNLYHNWWYPRIPELVTWLSQESTISLLILMLLFSSLVTTFKYVRNK